MYTYTYISKQRKCTGKSCRRIFWNRYHEHLLYVCTKKFWPFSPRCILSIACIYLRIFFSPFNHQIFFNIKMRGEDCRERGRFNIFRKPPPLLLHNKGKKKASEPPTPRWVAGLGRTHFYYPAWRNIRGSFPGIFYSAALFKTEKRNGEAGRIREKIVNDTKK